MRKNQVSLTDSIMTLVKPPTKRVRPWYDLIPKDKLEELNRFKELLRQGKLLDDSGMPVSKNSLSRAISKSLKDQKIADIGIQGITAWLNKN